MSAATTKKTKSQAIQSKSKPGGKIKKKNNLSVKLIPVQELIPYARNARVHTQSNIQRIAASIRQFGFNSPVLVDKKKGIIAGHGRVLAAESIGLKKIPAIELSHLSDMQKKAYIIADNKIAEDSFWDKEVLSLELEALSSSDIDIETLGFTDLKDPLDEDEKNKKQDPDSFYNDENCKMPIVPDFFEKHSCFIIVTHNEIDENFVRETLGLTKNHVSTSGDKKIRKTNVINVESLRKIWNKK